MKDRRKYSISAITSFFLLCGCQAPIVPVRNMKYSVEYLVNGEEFRISTTYKCYYEQGSWISEGGPGWHVRHNQPILIMGMLPDGAKYVVQPLDTRLDSFYYNYHYKCSDSENSVASQFFVASKDHPEKLDSFDNIRTNSDKYILKINKSVISLDSTSSGLFEAPDTHPDKSCPRNSYYTISAKIISADAIDRRGLRSYLTARKSIWLERGKFIPFIPLRGADRATMNLLNNNPILYSPDGGIEISGDYSKGAWVFDWTSSTNAISWFPWSVACQNEALMPDDKLPKDLVKFEDTNIEFYTAKYYGGDVYEPNADAIIVFYVTKADIFFP